MVLLFYLQENFAFFELKKSQWWKVAIEKKETGLYGMMRKYVLKSGTVLMYGKEIHSVCQKWHGIGTLRIGNRIGTEVQIICPGSPGKQALLRDALWGVESSFLRLWSQSTAATTASELCGIYIPSIYGLFRLVDLHSPGSTYHTPLSTALPLLTEQVASFHGQRPAECCSLARRALMRYQYPDPLSATAPSHCFLGCTWSMILPCIWILE